MRKTKIVCTLGPATNNPKVLEGLMRSGMDVARINFSHGNHAEHQKRMDEFKAMREKLGLPVALLLDTKGPEIRIRDFAGGKATLKNGAVFTLTTADVEGDDTRVSVTYAGLPNDVKPGTRILIDDGLIELTVEQIDGQDICCRVINGGTLSNKKSINIPGTSIRLPYISEKDKADILFGIQNDVDFIAASFVRTAYDVLDMRKILEENGGQHIQIIAKIENNEGVVNIDDILKVSEGLMVARGDTGVEIPFEDLPGIQKMLIEKCYKAGKMVITATQMLDSMIRNPRPTRAETTDVANAVYDGTSAVMLSGETAIGKFPVESVLAMAKIAEKTEGNIDYKQEFYAQGSAMAQSVTDAISHATCTTAMDLGATAIVTVTKSGHTARMVSRYRPGCPIVAVTTSKKVFHQLALSWGVQPAMGEEQPTTDELFEHGVDRAVKTGLVKNGDLVVITGGTPVGVPGTTNTLKAHLVGHVLVKGKAVTSLSVSGSLCVAKNAQDALRDFHDGDILVVEKTSNELLPLLKRAGGIITEAEGAASHAAIVGMTLEIPVITGAENATRILKSGTVVTIDGNRGLVYSGITKIV